LKNDITIEKLNIDIYLDDHVAPQQFLNQSVEEIKALVLPMVEQELAKLGYTDEDIVCDRIELNLESPTKDGWHEALGQQISENIQEAVAQASLMNTADQLLDTEGQNQTNTTLEPANDASPRKRLTPIAPSQNALLVPMKHFLTYGLLPTTGNTVFANYQELEARWLETEAIADLNAALLHELEQQPHLRKRFLNQASVAFKLSVLESSTALELLHFVVAVTAIEPPKTALRKKLWETLFTAAEKQKKSLAAWMPYFAKKATVQVQAELKLIAKELTNYDSIPQPLRRQIVELVTVATAAKPVMQQEETTLPSIKNTVEIEGIPVNNAGIVLLSPFLPTLFQNLKLIDAKNQWASEQEQVEAIYLLHYLAKGTFEATEDELFLAKIITAFPLDEVLPVLEEPPVFENLEKELEGLLGVIQENWRPMRNCTWEGLQRDFLSRAGTLQETDDNQYLLTPETHGLDVLLPHIEWGIGMMKYSWMEGFVIVEWEQ